MWNIETEDLKTVKDFYEKVADTTNIRYGGFKIYFLGVLLDNHLHDCFDDWLAFIRHFGLNAEFDFVQRTAGPDDEKWLIVCM